MINKMRRKALATALALTMIVGTVAGNGMVVKAADEDYTEETVSANSTDASVDPLAAGDNTVSISVTANTTVNGEKFVYNISVKYGQMKFNYDQGSVWNPATHSYGTSTGNGWDQNDNQAGNNDIKISNNSNMPVSISFGYTVNANTTNGTSTNSANAVTGVFSTDKDKFDYSGTDTSKICMNGTNSGKTKVNTYENLTLVLDSDSSNTKDTTTGTYIKTIGVLPSTHANANVFEDDVWFGLSGIPTTSYSGEVGTIQLIVNKESTTVVKYAGESY